MAEAGTKGAPAVRYPGGGILVPLRNLIAHTCAKVASTVSLGVFVNGKHRFCDGLIAAPIDEEAYPLVHPAKAG
jgi:hypothetical protein